MATALTRQVPRFLTAGRDSQNGIVGYLQRLVGSISSKGGGGTMGTINIPSGSTSIVVADPAVGAGDLFFVSVMVAGANVCYFTGVTAIVAGASYTLNVNTNPGAGGVTLAVLRLPAAFLFGS